MKSEVYSWRIDPDLKRAIEAAARSQQTSVARLLDRIVSEWLRGDVPPDEEEAVQRRLHEAAGRTLGAIRGGDPERSAKARKSVRERLRKQGAG